MTTGEEQSRKRLRDWYDLEADVLVEIEQEVIGSDYGANGYTTRSQVDDIAARLELGCNDRVLDIGTGRGWPALYLSTIYGCDVVATDVPIEGLKVGARRARRDGIDGQVRFAAARAEALPFRRRSFDAVVHTDTLCCAHHKRAVLKECARLLRPGGRMAFTTIHPALGLEPADMERVIECGPPEVAVDESHERMLALAGFSAIESVDVTASFSTTQQGWVDAWRAREDALIALLGPAPVAERKADRAALRAGIDEGLFRRTLYVARVRESV